MQDSGRDQPTTVSVLTAYARRHPHGAVKEQADDVYVPPPADVQAVLGALADRPADRDKRVRLLDLDGADLRGVAVAARGTAPPPLTVEVAGSPGSSQSWAAFRAANFDVTDLRHSRFYGVDLRDPSLLDANPTYVSWDYVDLSKATMQSADLSRSRMGHANLTGVDLSNAKLREAQWAVEWINLTKAILVKADLTGAHLDTATLRNAVLIGAKMRGASLAYANLHGARLSNVDKEAVASEFSWPVEANADLAKADLEGADLTNADLRGVDLTGATLYDADLRGARLDGAKLTGAKVDGARGLPPSLRP